MTTHNKSKIILFIALLQAIIFGACETRNEAKNNELDDLNALKHDFLESVLEGEIDEGPFKMSYRLRTVFFSKELVSLFGKFDEYVHLPHSWGRYEGKTLCKINGVFKEITLDDLFQTKEQKEFLRHFCEEYAKKHRFDYFSGDNPLCTTLDSSKISTFVVDSKFLRIIFQPYVAGSYVEGPFVVNIPHEDLAGVWDSDQILTPALNQALSSNAFISSWDEEGYLHDL